MSVAALSSLARANTVHFSGRDFYSPRSIMLVDEVPSLDGRGLSSAFHPIRLVGVTTPAAERVASLAGAIHVPGSGSGSGWFLKRRDPFPFDVAHAVLPRMAWRSVVPEIVDLVPRTIWYASLANLMVAGAWKSLAGRFWHAEQGCFQCGAGPMGLDAHEMWSYHGAENVGFMMSRYGPDAPAGVNVAVLREIRMLCGACHLMTHLGFTRNLSARSNAEPNSVRGGSLYERTFSRLRAVNRIVDVGAIANREITAYSEEIYRKYAARSKRRWALDVGALAGRWLPLTSGVARSGTDGLRFRGPQGPVSFRVLNCDFRVKDGRTFMVPRAPLSDA